MYCVSRLTMFLSAHVPVASIHRHKNCRRSGGKSTHNARVNPPCTGRSSPWVRLHTRTCSPSLRASANCCLHAPRALVSTLQQQSKSEALAKVAPICSVPGGSFRATHGNIGPANIRLGQQQGETTSTWLMRVQVPRYLRCLAVSDISSQKREFMIRTPEWVRGAVAGKTVLGECRIFLAGFEEEVVSGVEPSKVAFPACSEKPYYQLSQFAFPGTGSCSLPMEGKLQQGPFEGDEP